ncbi:MAG: hypothetical protein HC771_00855 [Synechococcales cyanobacterium CRU_2_2]|nr:hypothetical protein [Synechococcales cyanobacterium CRU_2_2]
MLPPRLPHGLHHLKDMAYGLALTLGLIGGPAVLAQTPVSLESCAPPASGEYLLLVVVQAPNAEEKLRQTLPPSVKAPTCNYLGTRVARMGGFRRPEDADAWASYLREVAALPAFIAQPPKAGEVRAKVGTEVSTGVPAIANVPSPQVLPPKSSPQVLVPPLGAAPVGETAQPMSLPASSAIPKPDLSARGSVSRYPNATVSVPAPGSAPPFRCHPWPRQVLRPVLRLNPWRRAMWSWWTMRTSLRSPPKSSLLCNVLWAWCPMLSARTY